MVMHQEIIYKDEEISKLRSSLKKVKEEGDKLKEEVESLKKAQFNSSFNTKRVCHTYSECLKSGRPDFGIFRSCPVVKSSGFRISSENRTFIYGFRTSGFIYFRSPVIGRPVPNRRNRPKPVRNRF